MAVRTAVGIAGTVYVLAALLLFVFQREMIFPGQHVKIDRKRPVRPGVEAFDIETAAGRSVAWLLRPFDVDADEARPVVFFGHGNGEVIDDWPDHFEQFRRWGMNVVLVEYPGYGRAEGSPSEGGIREAMVGAYDRIVGLAGIDRGRILGFGRSLGGGAICALARDRHLSAMVLHSTFTSLRSLAGRFFMPSFLVRDPFDNDEVVRGFAGPILVLHGRSDDLIPVDQGIALAALAPRASLKLYDCGHNCDTPATQADIAAFLEQNHFIDRPHDLDEGRG